MVKKNLQRLPFLAFDLWPLSPPSFPLAFIFTFIHLSFSIFHQFVFIMLLLLLIIQLLFLFKTLLFHHDLRLRYFPIVPALNLFCFQIHDLGFLCLENLLLLLKGRIKCFELQNLNFYFQGCSFCLQQDKMIKKLHHFNLYLNSKDCLNLPNWYQLNYSSNYESYYLKDLFNYTDLDSMVINETNQKY